MCKTFKLLFLTLFALALAGGCQAASDSENFKDVAEFCGFSSEGPCASDQDCIIGGCSGQVCQSGKEEPVVTTCEFKDCYRSEDFGLNCKCEGGKCGWK